jgi:uncharacterized protein
MSRMRAVEDGVQLRARTGSKTGRRIVSRTDSKTGRRTDREPGPGACRSAGGPAWLLLALFAGGAGACATQVEPSAQRPLPFGRMAEPPPTAASGVESLRVGFLSQGHQLAGVLYFRHTTNPTHLPAAVIVAGSWTSVKEQMPARYAPLLADAGYATLIFDFRGYGESEGLPREVESAALKAADIRAAVAYLQKNGGVDSRRIGVLAICASAAYTALAAQEDPGIKSIAMIAPWLHNREIVRQIYGGEAAVAARLEQGRVARQIFGESGIVSYIKLASSTDPSAAMFGLGDPVDYYLDPKRGAIPQWRARFAVMGWPEWLQLDAIALADKLEVPTRIVTGQRTITPDGARAFAARLKGPHDIVELDAQQADFYDQPRTVSSAAAAAIAHFRRTL